MKSEFWQPKDVENVSNMPQSIWNIIINDQKHILDVYSTHKRQPKKDSWTTKNSQVYKTRQKVSLYFVLELKLFKIKTNLFQLSKYFTKIDACTFSRLSEQWDDLEFLLCKNTP